MKRYEVGIIGVGGFARSHLDALEECEHRGWARLTAAAVRPQDREAQRSTVEALLARGVRLHSSAEELMANERGALDMIVVPTGIDQHASLSIAALDGGFHVFCEKPAAGTVEEALEMLAAQKRSGRVLAVGFQNLFSPSINRIKQIALDGSLGALRSARTMVLWPRGSDYYARNEWAGRLAVHGRWIFDSPVQNAVAHFLQNMLYVAGGNEHDCMEPFEVYAESYRAKPIDSCDTQFLRIRGAGRRGGDGSASDSGSGDVSDPAGSPAAPGPEITMMVSHACRDTIEPVSEFLFEHGRILWELEPKGTTELYRLNENGWVLEDLFDNGGEDLGMIKYRALFDALDEGRPPHSTIDNALAHTRCVNAAFRDQSGAPAAERIATIDRRYLDKSNSGTIEGIETLIAKMFRSGASFSEQGAPWGVPGATVRLGHPGGAEQKA